MTPEEAHTIAAVVVQADGQCIVCVAALAGALEEQLPGYDWLGLVAEASGCWMREEVEDEWKSPPPLPGVSLRRCPRHYWSGAGGG
jgi:hypothetical protein